MSQAVKKFIFIGTILFFIVVSINIGLYYAFASMLPLELQDIKSVLGAIGLKLLATTLASVIALGCIVYSAVAVWKSRSILSIILLLCSIILWAAVAVITISRMSAIMIENIFVLPTLPEGMELEELPGMEGEQPQPAPAEKITTKPSKPEAHEGIKTVTTKAEFDQILKSSSKPVVLKGSATWCGPCQTMKPIYEKIARELGDTFTFVELDVDHFDNGQALGIEYLPTFAGYKNGKQVFITSGEKDPQELKQLIMKLH